MGRPILSALLVCGALFSAPGIASAREVVVAIGLSIPPYVIAAEARGMEYDVVKEALALEGHVLKAEFLPLARMAKALKGGLVDAALTQIPGMTSGTVLSEVYITYRNFAITLASHDLKVDSIDDLAGKSILAFQNAHRYLGEGFRRMAEANPRYREEANQQAQPMLLFHDRVDVVVADHNIFRWFASRPEVTAKADTSRPIRMHALFPPTEYRVAFRDPALRDDFNRGLAKLRAGGEYDRIVARYADLMLREPSAALR